MPRLTILTLAVTAAVAASAAPTKPDKKAPAPNQPDPIELLTIEVGKSPSAPARPPEAPAIKVAPTPREPVKTAGETKTTPLKPAEKSPAPKAPKPVAQKTGKGKTSPPPAPRTTLVSPIMAPLKPVAKPSTPKKTSPKQQLADKTKAAKPTPPRPAPTPAAPRPPQPAPTPMVQGPAAYTLSAPVDFTAMVREGRATLTSSKTLSGKLEYLFDPNRSTEVASLAMSTGPAYWQMTLDRPRQLDAIDLAFGDGGPFQWTLSGAQTSADLQSRQGTYRIIVPARLAEADDQIVFPATANALPRLRVYRLEAKPLAGVGEVRLSSLALWTPQELRRIDIDTIIPRVGVGSRLPLKAIGSFELGARQNLTPDVTWEVSPPEAGKVDDLVRLEGKAPGKATVSALFKETRSTPFAVDVVADAKPDWSVTYIERGPRVPVDGPQPKIGSKVVWFAHVKNYGAADAPQVAAEWRVDGKTHAPTTVAKLNRFQQTDVMLPLVWDGKRHHVELVIDPANQTAEETEVNNSLSVATDSLGVGMWVEESVVRYFHQKQRDLGIGSNGWEDWAQRQVASWNKFQSQAAGLFQSAPEAGVRWRIDRLHIVGDGLLPMAGGSPEWDPDRRDRSVHLMLGFPAGDPTRSPYRLTSKASPDNPFFMQQSLLKSVTRAIYPRPASAQPIASGG